MVIIPATISDAPVIHDLMIRAFMEYRTVTPSSSALDETIQSISDAMDKGEKALIAFEENKPVGMVRFQLKQNSLDFYRLSVIPEKQGQGLAKKILKCLEDYAYKVELPIMSCKVRANVQRNLLLYSSMGYAVYGEEIVHKPDGISLKIVLMKKRIDWN